MESITNQNEKKSDMILWLAFGAVYILWGSTYLALRFVLESMPPFLMAAFRFMTAGTIMLLVARFSNHQWPSAREIKNSSIVGFLLLVIGNGGVVWAEQYIDSGIAALLVTIEPVWVVLLLWMKSNNQKPSAITWIAIFLGIAGMLVLTGPVSLGAMNHLNPWAVASLLVSSLSWAIGSVYALQLKMPSSASMNTAFQMLAAGLTLLLIGSVRGEWIGFELSSITTNSWLGFLYLIVFGSLMGFTSYGYIVRNASPTSVSTYAYVNPVIAVFLGWWLGNERVGIQTLVAALLLVSAVVIIIMKPELKLKIKF